MLLRNCLAEYPPEMLSGQFCVWCLTPSSWAQAPPPLSASITIGAPVGVSASTSVDEIRTDSLFLTTPLAFALLCWDLDRAHPVCLSILVVLLLLRSFCCLSPSSWSSLCHSSANRFIYRRTPSIPSFCTLRSYPEGFFKSDTATT